MDLSQDLAKPEMLA
jgi:hypothetical protein